MTVRSARRSASIVTLVLLLCAATTLGAQGVRVQVVDDRTREPIGGAIVSLIDGAGNAVAEGLTAASGHRLLTASSAGDHRILVRRVGYVPVSSPPIPIPAGEPISYVLAVSGQRVVLPSVVSRARRACRTDVQEVARTAVLWEEIRKALTASELTKAEGYSPVQLRVFEREMDREGKVRTEAWSPWATTTQSPFIATSPAELSRKGYLLREDGRPASFTAPDLLEADVQWHGPDAAVLLSPEFERDHCFQVVSGAGFTAGAIGLAFAPHDGRKLPDIAGTLWVDRETAQLRFVEFEYVNSGLPGRMNGGGRIEFRRLSTGEWIVSEWSLRYPRILVGQRGRNLQLSGFNEVGGQAGEARFGAVAGSVYDSLAGTKLGGARISMADRDRSATTGTDGRFTLDSIHPGTHELRFAHPVLDSLGIGAIPVDIQVAPDDTTRVTFAIPSHRRFRSICGGVTRVGPDSGLVAGSVLDGEGGTIANAAVTLSWFPTAPTADSTSSPRVLVARSDVHGKFAVCGLPVGIPIVARAATDHRASPDTHLLIGNRAVARLDLVLRPPQPPPLPAAVPPRAALPRRR